MQHNLVLPTIQIGAGRRKDGQGLFNGLPIFLAVASKAHAARLSLEQDNPKLAFQLFNPLGDSAVRKAQGLGSALKVTEPRYDSKYAQRVQIDGTRQRDLSH